MNALLNLQFDVRGELLDAARQCEEDVFLEAFGNTRQQLEDEYGPYNDQSVFVAVTDDSGEVYGSARLIIPGPAGNKTINDISRAPWHVDGQQVGPRGADRSRQHLGPGHLGVHRRCTAVEGLSGGRGDVPRFHAVHAGERGQDGHVDARPDRLPGAHGQRFPVHHIAGHRDPAEYLGSPKSTPVFGHWSDIADAQRRLNPEAYRMITLGIGLDGISIPSAQDFVVKPRRVPAGAEVAAEPGAVVAA